VRDVAASSDGSREYEATLEFGKRYTRFQDEPKTDVGELKFFLHIPGVGHLALNFSLLAPGEELLFNNEPSLRISDWITHKHAM
jgi:hypothetical protein